jgi:hypothetical protein
LPKIAQSTLGTTAKSCAAWEIGGGTGGLAVPELEYNAYGLEFAHSVINNPHPYYARASNKHREPDLEWIEITLANP